MASPGFGPAAAPGVGFAAGAGVSAGAGLAAGAPGLGPVDGVDAAGLAAAVRGSAPGFGPGFDAAALGFGDAAPVGLESAGAESAPPAGLWASRRRRTTGASSVEDADLTNSP